MNSLTVITVTYNAEQTLERTLKSVQEQTYPAIQHLIVDGKSADGTVDLIRRHEHDKMVWVSEPDEGLYHAMNKAIGMAAGDYLCFLNAGDTFYEASTVEKLMGYGVKALVIACNTATAAAIEMLRQRYPDTIVIGIEPAVKIAAEHFPKGTIGVLATPVTLSAEKYKQLSQRFENGCQVIPIPAPGLAGLVEEGKINDPETRKLLETLLTPYVGKLDALVLGCTHYPFVKTQICQILGKSVPLYDGGEGTAKETKRRLEAADLLHDGSGTVRLENSIPGEETLQRTMRLLKTGVEDAYE